MSAEFRRLRRALLLGFVITAFVAVPGIFVPATVLEFMGARPPAQPVWPGFAFLLSFLVSTFFWVAARNPSATLWTTRLSILSRFVWAGFWYWGYPVFEHTPSPWWWIVELTLGIVQFWLFLCAQRDANLRVAS